jgi:zinc transporter ZupT
MSWLSKFCYTFCAPFAAGMIFGMNSMKLLPHAYENVDAHWWKVVVALVIGFWLWNFRTVKEEMQL